MRLREQVLVMAAFGLAVAGCQKEAGPSPRGAPNAGGLNIGQQAPEIAGTDLDGKELKLSDYRGKVVLLDFWASW